MLRKPYTMNKLLGLVKSVLPQSTGTPAEMVPVENRASQAAAERLRF